MSNDVVFRNYTRIMTRTKKLYFRGFPFPVPVAEGAITLGILYIYWKFLMPAIPTWVPILGGNGFLQIIFGVLLAVLAFVGVKVRTKDNRPIFYGVVGFFRARFGTKVYNPRSGRSVSRRPETIIFGELSHD